MNNRKTLKNLLKFAKKEYREKKPLTLQILKVKDKTAFTRGILPLLKMNIVNKTQYIITTEYDNYVRIYSFSMNGTLLGGENFEKTLELEKKILMSTTLRYRLPKKER